MKQPREVAFRLAFILELIPIRILRTVSEKGRSTGLRDYGKAPTMPLVLVFSVSSLPGTYTYNYYINRIMVDSMASDIL
jgi:hypothetical protein